MCGQERDGARPLSPCLAGAQSRGLLTVAATPLSGPAHITLPILALPSAPKHPATYPAHETSAHGISYGKSRFLIPVGNTK